MKRLNSTAATSAIPIGIPGCPDFAASTASMASARTAFAIVASLASVTCRFMHRLPSRTVS